MRTTTTSAQLTAMEHLALDAEAELAETRAALVQAESNLRELSERFDAVEQERDDADCLEAELIEAWDAATEGRDVGGAALERLRAVICAVRARLVSRREVEVARG